MRKHSAKIYAKALTAVLGKKDIDKQELAKYLDNFLALVAKNQDQKSLNKIYQIAQNGLLSRFGLSKFLLETARNLEQNDLKEIKEKLGSENFFEQNINPELLAGLKIIKNENQQIDFSLNNKLKKLFYEL